MDEVWVCKWNLHESTTARVSKHAPHQTPNPKSPAKSPTPPNPNQKDGCANNWKVLTHTNAIDQPSKINSRRNEAEEQQRGKLNPEECGKRDGNGITNGKM
ncbi:uncharacterized protein BO95DRAFT_432073 [Aspergillus brunneoviolaceus CBS 621.78]|uniref:Uncharacterized protein n=1 Tax=Aspergillus brunneoviolaceus CBS 621.78 TaxID=1450534 RepID=A0ACD1G8Y0_9EURO|nr:hypothetical protein BO95DRAFT_432073 [Aspergillus brunneoviolaceus CBS 621.78]RAH45637.1 hypothetical protein BO95DRAFT_432073 [Aspergillus brunneoviolaceus CBS 621.78]